MATILTLPPRQARPARSEAPAPGTTGDIVFFTGVRIERPTDDGAATSRGPNTPRGSKPNRHRKF